MIKIEKISYQVPVYDITVEDNQNFYANDILIHNCSEIVQYTDESTTAICTLSSIPVQKFWSNGKFNWKKYEKVIRKVTRVLNKAIDINKYSTTTGKKGGKEQRAMGIGIQGLADLFNLMKTNFDSDRARRINKKLYEYIYYYSIDESNLIAQEQSTTYGNFIGSPMSKGIFQFDMWDNVTDKDFTLDWNILKDKVKDSGVINSMFVTQMPTAGSAALLGSAESNEVRTSNSYVRKVKGGEFIVVNTHLIDDLSEINLWNETIQNKLINANGSIQEIYEIPEEIRLRHRTAFEMSQKTVLDMSRERAIFIDQSQSQNIFMNKPTASKLTSCHFYAWGLGLKTGLYYLRTKAISTGAKHLAGIKQTQTTNLNISNSNEDEDCLMCSS